MRLRTAVDELPAAMRDVVLMHFFAEATLKEISQTLGIPLGTVKSRLFYALERLREKCKAF